jgi:hypothetical protein
MAYAVAAQAASADAKRVPVLHLMADGSVLAVADGSDATLVLSPELRQPSPPQRPVAATLAPATPLGLPITSSLTLALGADRQGATRLLTPCAPVSSPLQPTCGTSAAPVTYPLLDTSLVAAGLSYYRSGGGVYSLTLGRSALTPATAAPWTVPGYSLEMSRAPVPVLAPSPQIDASTNSVTVAGVWSLNTLGALSVSGSLAESLLRSPTLPQGRAQDRAALGISLSRGTLSGGLVGHVNSQSQAGLATAGWGGLDLGVTWRTPWSGQFVFGTRNLVTYGDESQLPDPAANKALDESRERTPYVEYRQDF